MSATATAAPALDLSAARLPPLPHQVVGVQALVDHHAFFLTDQMGLMKSAQILMAALVLYQRGVINRLIIVAPPAVRTGVWFDAEVGQLAKHLWRSVDAEIIEYHRRSRVWYWTTKRPLPEARLQIICTNYEFLRNTQKWLAPLLRFCTPHTLLVGDESTALKNAQAQQTKAFAAMRRRCGRVVLATGTPVANNPLDLWSQAQILDPSILDCPSMDTMKARYTTQEPVLSKWRKTPLLTKYGTTIKAVTGFKNLEDLQRRIGPYALRRVKCELDLPPKLDAVTLVATLSTEWPSYVAMRDQLVVELASGDVSRATQAIVKIVRLAQITSGHLGGVEEAGLDLPEDDDAPRPAGPTHVEEVGRAKLDTLLAFLDQQLEADPAFKVVIGSRFRPEVARVAQALRDRYPAMAVAPLVGGQSRAEREVATHLLHPDTAPPGPAALVMTSAGSMGIDCTAAACMVRLSWPYSPHLAEQAEDRLHRPGQRQAVSYVDIVAQGPKGQPTIDRVILAALRDKTNVATWTASAWVQSLKG